MQAFAVSCIKQSCVSILESMLSMYEYHFDGTINMGEENINEEIFISEWPQPLSLQQCH